MTEEPKFLRILNGETKYMNLASLHKELLVTARDRSVQRESVWRTESDNKQGKYLSNVEIGYAKTALLHMINVDPNIKMINEVTSPEANDASTNNDAQKDGSGVDDEEL